MSYEMTEEDIHALTEISKSLKVIASILTLNILQYSDSEGAKELRAALVHDIFTGFKDAG